MSQSFVLASGHKARGAGPNPIVGLVIPFWPALVHCYNLDRMGQPMLNTAKNTALRCSPNRNPNSINLTPLKRVLTRIYFRSNPSRGRVAQSRVGRDWLNTFLCKPMPWRLDKYRVEWVDKKFFIYIIT